jgi:hypothetical protein
MLLAHGNQSIQPGSVMQNLISANGAGYLRLLQAHENYQAPLTLHLTATTASALQWAKNPDPGAANDGPAFNTRLSYLLGLGRASLLGSTFSDHIPKYFPLAYNAANIGLANQFLDTIYGHGASTASRKAFWAPERVLDSASLAQIAQLGYTHTFADQTRHFVKWFGRTSALGIDGFRINEVNGVKIFPIHDFTSEYLDQVRDGGSALPVRELLSRRARSNVQDQLVVLWRDLGDFSSLSKANAYDANVRWLSSRPWIRVVTADDIIEQRVAYRGQDGNTYTNWGAVARGTGLTLPQTAKDWVDHATQENYDNWYFGSIFEEGLSGRLFGATQPFGQVGVSGHAHTTWQNLSSTSFLAGLAPLAGSAFHAAMFQTAFHTTTNNNLSKFSTGAYIFPDTDSGQSLAGFAREAQAQARFANVFTRVQAWAGNATSSTLGTEAVDLDLDGQPEYLLYNSRVFALFKAKGGRMTAAWMRDPNTGKIWQVAGNFASASGSDSDDEGATSVIGSGPSIAAHRTSGFKDWWVVNTSNVGNNAQVNANYTVQSAPSGTGWTFTSDGGVTKTIRLPHAASERLEGTYTLTGLSRAFIRFGLSPNLLGLLLRGQEGLTETFPSTTRVNVTNTSLTETVRAWVEGPLINSAASDSAPATFTTFPRRNQAQTNQVEVELIGPGPHVVSLGFDLGENLTHTDTDGNGLGDAWETEHFGSLGQSASSDPDGDGFSNRLEYLFNSDPNSALSGQPATSLNQSESGFLFTFPTHSGRLYQPQVSNDLGTWTNLGPRLPGTNAEQTVLDPEPGERKFYRILISSP